MKKLILYAILIAALLALLSVSAFALNDVYGVDPEAVLGTGPLLQLEQDLKAEILKISNGERTNTVIEILYPSGLGLSDFTGTAGEENTKKLLNTLFRDCACELYWWEDVKQGDTVASTSSFTQKFYVDTKYQDSTASDYTHTVDAAKIGEARFAMQKARQIAEAPMELFLEGEWEEEELNDLDILRYYFDEIRSRSEYNTSAAGKTPTEYGSSMPWNLISIFDGDPNTQAICSGFAKAFQYLCDNGVVSDPGFRCYTVSGVMGAGTHTWNIVQLNGKRYVVDAAVGTAMESGVSHFDSFMRRAYAPVTDGYTLEDGRTYTYDKLTQMVFPGDRLTLEILPHSYNSSTKTLTVTTDGMINFQIKTDSPFFSDGAETIVFSGISGICEYVFENCDSVRKVVIPSGVTEIANSTFTLCDNLETVVLPSGLTAIGAKAFYKCPSLSSVNLPASLTSIGNFAFWESGLTGSLTIPANVTSIGNNAFRKCTGLTGFTLPASLPESALGSYILYECTGIQTLTTPLFGTKKISDFFNTIPTSLTTLVITSGTAIPEQYCLNASGLTSVTFPSGLKSIGASAFYNCTSLTEVHLGAALESIADYAFWKCASLTDVYYAGTETAWAAVTKGTGWAPSGVTVHYASKPTITTQPKSVTVANGAKATFTVAASGEGMLKYQWQYSSNGTSWSNTTLTGYNTNKLTVTASPSINGRYYRCVVSNAAGSVNSSKAKLTVGIAPSITAQPANVTVATGAKATFTVTATGTATLKYQWQYSTNGTSWSDTTLTGCNTNTLTVTANSTTNGRYYRCIVSNTWGSIPSSAGKLTVILSAPAAPTNLAAGNNLTTGRIKLSWKASTGATGYNVYRSTSKTGTYEKLNTSPVTELTYTDGRSGNAGNTYWYKITAVNSVGESAKTAAVSQIAKCQRPTGLKATANTDGSVTLTWDAPMVKGSVSFYRVYLWDTSKGAFQWINGNLKAAGTATTVKVPASYLTAYKGKSVQFSLRGYNTKNVLETISIYAVPASATVK